MVPQAEVHAKLAPNLHMYRGGKEVRSDGRGVPALFAKANKGEEQSLKVAADAYSFT